MKFITLTRKGLIMFFCCLLMGAIALTITIRTASKAITTATEPRDIPIYCVETEEKKVAISFDAAWGNEQTETLLNILEEKNVKATFFLVGEWVEKYPDSVKLIAEKGHDVENHSSTHAYMTKLSTEDMISEITNCNKLIEELTGECPTLFRPPYGDYNNQVVSAVKGAGMYCIQWDIETLATKVIV